MACYYYSKSLNCNPTHSKVAHALADLKAQMNLNYATARHLLRCQQDLGGEHSFKSPQIQKMVNIFDSSGDQKLAVRACEIQMSHKEHVIDFSFLIGP